MSWIAKKHYRQLAEAVYEWYLGPAKYNVLYFGKSEPRKGCRRPAWRFATQVRRMELGRLEKGRDCVHLFTKGGLSG